MPVELTAMGETRESIEQKLDSIFNLGPFMAAREHILGDAFDGKKFWDMKNPNIQDYIIRMARAMYLSNVKSLDEHLGLLIKALEDSGKLQNTFIVYASDNGAAVENFQSAGKMRGYKGVPFEGGVKTFAIISGPNIPRNSVYDGIFHITDWLPTLARAAGIDSSEFDEIDGIDENRWLLMAEVEERKEE